MDDRDKLASLIKGIRFAMLTTVGQEGKLHSRPMATLESEFDGNLWFFTDDSSPKVYELYQNRHVTLTYADADSHTYVAVCGTGEITRDGEMIRHLWRPELKAWFPGGKDDPHLVLIKVGVESAEYWEGPTAPARLVGMAKAALSGDPYEGGTNEKLELKPTG
jgi:general stress protein 26